MDTTELHGRAGPLEERPQTEYAGFLIRLAAHLVDSGCVVLVATSVALLSGTLGMIAGLAFSIANAIVLLGRSGQTVGMKAAGIRVLQEDGTTLGYWRAFYRGVLAGVTCLPLGLGAIWIAFDQRKQGLYDRLAHTLAWRLEPAGIGSHRARGMFVAGSAVAVSVPTLMLTVVLPHAIGIFQDLGIANALPTPTQLLVQASNAVTTHWFLGAWMLPGMISILALIATGRCPLPGRKAVWLVGLLVAAAVVLMVVSFALPLISATHQLRSGAYSGE